MSAYQNKIYVKLLKEFNYVSLTSRHNISEQAFLHKTVNGGLDNSTFLIQLILISGKVTYVLNIFSLYHIPKVLMFKNSPLLRMCDTYNTVTVKYPKLDFSLSFVQYLKLLKMTYTTKKFNISKYAY
jgi:hypothetical protein